MKPNARPYLNALVVQFQAVRDAAHEYVADLEPISTLLRTALHPAVFVHDPAFDDTVTDSFPNDVFGILLRVKVELDTYVPQGDPGVRQRKPSDAGLDDILTQTHNEGVRLVRLKLRRVLGERRLELR